MKYLAPLSLVCILIFNFSIKAQVNYPLEVGLSIGSPLIGGEVRNEARIGALALTLEKPFSNRISFQYQLLLADARGQDWRRATLPLFRNYRNLMVDQSLQFVSYISAPTSKIRISVSAGVNVLGYHTEMDLLDDNNLMYSYENTAIPSSYSDKSLILSDLEALQDGHYETELKGDPLGPGYDRDLKIRLGLTAGIGVKVPVSDRLAINLAYRLSWYGDAWLDGVNTSRLGLETNRSDLLHVPSVGFSLGLGKSETMNIPAEEVTSLTAPPVDDQYEEVKNRVASLEQALYQLDHQVVGNSTSVEAIQAQLGEHEVVLASLVHAQQQVPQSEVFSQSIFFESGKYKVIPAHYSVLAQVSGHAEAYSAKKFEVLGYADQLGDMESNEALARQRAEAVVQFLIHTFGIEKERISVIVVGEVTNGDAQADVAVYRKVTIKTVH